MRTIKVGGFAHSARYFLTGLMIAAAAPLVANAASLQEIKDRGYMEIATEDSYAPFEIMKDGKASGFTNDVVAELREYADFEIRQEIMPWSGLLTSLRAGKFDAAITGSIVSEERLRVFDFAVPTASAQHYYIKRKDDDRIQSVEDLDELTVGVQAGSVLLSRLPELNSMLEKTGGKLGQIVEYTSYPEIYEDLSNGRLDYVVNAIVNAQDLIKQRGDIFVIGEPVTGPGFHAYPVPKGQDGVLEYLNEFVIHLSETGKLAELQSKWFGITFPDLPLEPITSFEEFQMMTTVQ